jgi:mono/diheme cytochrome c family protein
MPMKRIPALRLLIASLALASAGHADADSAGRWQSGQEAYKKVCAYCHEANVGPALTGRNLPPAYITTVVRMGNRAMPAFRPSEINDDVLNSLAQTISASAPGTKK